MQIVLNRLKPNYMSESEVAGSDIYLQEAVCFEQGRRYLVRAKSGHGKTSLLNFIYGSSHAYEGTLRLEPTPDPARLRTHVLSYMFQDLCLFPQLTAMENVILKNRLTDFKSGSEIEAMLDALLPSEKKHQPVGTLSLGQRQRVAAVRALCQPMCWLLMDEPFSHIDQQNTRLVADLVLGETGAQGAGLIVTALDPNECFPFDTVLNL